MAKHFGHALFLLFFILVLHASSCEQEDYWKMKLPNVPMPPAIKDNLFHPHDTKERKVEDIGSSTIVTKEKKDGLNQPWTVLSWDYDTNMKKNAKLEDIKSSTTGTKVKKVSLNQPWTVLSWDYDTNKKEMEKSEDTELSKFGTEVKKVSLNQPFTVLAWDYDTKTKKNAKLEDKSSTIGNKVSKVHLNQPWTVLSWDYDTNKKEMAKSEDTELSKFGTEVKKVSLNQPFTVLAWDYDTKTKKNAKLEDKSSTIGNKVSKVHLNQPWTVLSWDYDTNKKEMTKSEDTELSKLGTEVKKVSLNQPFTVLAWDYDTKTKKNEKLEDKSSTIGNKVSKVHLNQPWTVLSWDYDTNKKEMTKSEDTELSKLDTEVKKVSLNQPWTVLSWDYKAGKTEKDAKEEEKSHHHDHHAMHNNKKYDDDDAQEDGGSVFFVEKSLRLGMTLKHDFQKTPRIPFLPQHIAQLIPFSFDRITEIFNLFSVEPSSAQARAIMVTLDMCLHKPKVKKENRTCAHSMEDVVNFVVEELGTNDVELRMMRNDIEVVNGIKDYVLTKVKKLVVPGNNAVACHRMSYPYVVYYCHHQQDIGHYDVTLVSPTSGTAIQTTAVCHYDTYAWKPDVPALKYLGIRPGDAPVCHFSAINDMFWTIKDNTKFLDMAQ